MFMDEKLILVSWASPDDPAQGEFQFRMEDKQCIIRKAKSTYHWKSGVSGDFISDDILPTVSSLLLNTSGSNFDPRTLIRGRNYSNNMSSSKTNMNMRLDPCNVFRACGNSASCNSKNNKSMCECLPGFEPISPDNWDSRDFSEGCRRSLPICSNKVEKIQSFRPLQVIKVGRADMNFDANSENECKEECLKACDCQAYSFKMPENSQLRGDTANKACWIWSDDLNNIQLNDTDEGHEIHLRMQLNIVAEANQTKQDESNKQFKQWPLAFAVTAAILGLDLMVFGWWVVRRCGGGTGEPKSAIDDIGGVVAM
ncbi:hypothetical protein Q3G72_006486 [Acer saccharum]|nr:hypothetical protein Q3G72_006486 [Acer saccharum]